MKVTVILDPIVFRCINKNIDTFLKIIFFLCVSHRRNKKSNRF